MKKITFSLAFIIACLLVFATPGPVRAARLVPGSVPQNRPLQPLPADTQPNVSKNIIDNQGQPPAGLQTPETQTPNVLEPNKPSPTPPATANLPAKTFGGKFNPLLIIFFAVLAGLGIVSYFLTNQKPRP